MRVYWLRGEKKNLKPVLSRGQSRWKFTRPVFKQKLCGKGGLGHLNFKVGWGEGLGRSSESSISASGQE